MEIKQLPTALLIYSLATRGRRISLRPMQMPIICQFAIDFKLMPCQPIVTKISGTNLTLQSVMDTQILWKEIKTLAAQGETIPWLSRINVGTVIGVSAGLSAGYIMMAFRWGALITSGLAATYPVWQWIDPLPILESSKDKSDNEKLFGESEQNAKSQMNESLESLMS